MKEKRENVIKDGDIVSNFPLLYDKKFVIYGAGERGDEVYEILSNFSGAEIIAYCETDVKTWIQRNNADSKNGIRVLSLDELVNGLNVGEMIFIVATKSVIAEKEIIENIETNYDAIRSLVTWTAFYLSVLLNIRNKRFGKIYQEWFIERNELRVNSMMAEFIDSSFESAMNKDGILVYQPAKVGSFSVYQGIKKLHIPCAHIHRIIDVDGRYSSYYKNYSELHHIWKNMQNERQKIKIITLVRDPVMRSISAIFQCIFPNCVSDMELGKNLYDNVLLYIKKDAEYGKYGYMFEWFNDELRNLTGIDIYKYDFNKDDGYGIIKDQKYEILCLTMEKLDQNEEVIKNFIGGERGKNFRLLRENIGTEKNYRYLYENVKKIIKIPKDILDFYYKENQAMKYFYTDEYINELLNRYDS